ncbi:MAG TPA: XrtA system polysaccharide deacetylase [Candidatus Tectomicrobia bacterium]|nr:XrtA system polysaccharide deacetylase [Candidatus Tectomicrobia bacterium]
MGDRPANILTVDVEEYYHGVEFGEVQRRDASLRLPSRVVESTRRLLDLLDAHGARGTFFTLGIVARRHPRLVRRIVERGHELASHGWDHTPLWVQDPRQFRADVRRARRVLEDVAGVPVLGYRAPNFSIGGDMPWALEILAEEGYRYDSSVYPIVHDRYGLPSAPRFPHVAARIAGVDLWEVPIGTARALGVNLPVGGGYLRLFPASLVADAIAAVNRRERRPVVLYLHPWELDPHQPRPSMPWRHRFRHYVGLARMEGKLARLLSTLAFTSVDHAVPALAPPAAAVARAS